MCPVDREIDLQTWLFPVVLFRLAVVTFTVTLRKLGHHSGKTRVKRERVCVRVCVFVCECN